MNRQTTIRYISRYVSLCVLIAFLTGCFAQQQVVMESVPAGATVFLIKGNNKKKIKLGTTPVTYRGNTSEDPVIFEFNAKGYLPTEIVVATPYRAQTKIRVNLKTISDRWFQSTLTTDLANEVNDLMEYLYDLEVILASKSYEEAVRIIGKVTDKYNKFSLFHSSVGHFYYQKKRFRKARFHFQEVLNRKPDDQDAKTMLEVIRNL